VSSTFGWHNFSRMNWIQIFLKSTSGSYKVLGFLFRIIVLHEGRVVEFDSSNALLESKKSIFYKMAENAGLIQRER